MVEPNAEIAQMGRFGTDSPVSDCHTWKILIICRSFFAISFIFAENEVTANTPTAHKEVIMLKPLCFVLMPFGRKNDEAGRLIDFDAVYQELIIPAVIAAGMEVIRADEEQAGGIIHKPMFERLLLCEYAVADLTTANANVFYELGIRHATRRWSTIPIFAEGSRLPFDVSFIRAVPYKLTADGKPANNKTDAEILSKKLIDAKDPLTDSPLYSFDLISNQPDIAREKTDVFRDRVRYSAAMKGRLAAARKEGMAALELIETELGNIRDAEGGVVIDLFLSYRSIKAWPEMIALASRMSQPLAKTTMIREQLALALNRAGRSEEAEAELIDLIARRGPSSETYGILGRVYKDRWNTASEKGEATLAKDLLEKAINAYLKGFETDWRDAYPGINAVTLMEIKEPPDPERKKLLPVVTYAAERRIAAGKADYWDYATLLELAILNMDEKKANAALASAAAAVREFWEPETTARNLRMIGMAREKRGITEKWIQAIEKELEGLAKQK